MTYWGAGEQTLGLDVSMLVRDGDGRCGAWAELFETALLIHSVGEIEDVTIVSIYGDSGSNAYMMIKNYSFYLGNSIVAPLEYGEDPDVPFPSERTHTHLIFDSQVDL